MTPTASFYLHGGRTEFADDATLEDLWRFKDGTWEELRTTGQRPPPLSYHVASSHEHFLYLFGVCRSASRHVTRMIRSVDGLIRVFTCLLR